MTALNPLNPTSASKTSTQRQKQRRRNGKNESVASHISKNNRISPVKSSIASTSQLSSPSIHIPGLPEINQQPKGHHRLTSPALMSSKSTLDDIDDLDDTNNETTEKTSETQFASRF